MAGLPEAANAELTRSVGLPLIDYAFDSLPH
jgi:hypothetical protein